MRTLAEVAAPDALSAAASLLISGGCDARGRVPLMAHLDTLRGLAANHRLNLHVGLIDEDEARALAPLAEVVSFDVVGDRRAAREVYGLDVGLDDYMRTLDALRRHVAVVPHVTIGLRGGQPSGEFAALAMVDAVARLIPGVLGNELSAGEDSFGDGLLEYPHFTRPAEFAGMRVPEVLLSGNHGEIARWRRRERLRRTLERRPDLLDRARLTAEERSFVAALQRQGDEEEGS